MAKLTRVTGKVFGGNAPLNQIGQFGSALAGTPNNTQDVAEIQALDAYSNGWGSAVISSRNFPPIEEVTGALKTISYQSCYLLQEGIPEYDINTEYSNTSVVKSINGNELIFYISLQNNNIGNPLTNSAYWYMVQFAQKSYVEQAISVIESKVDSITFMPDYSRAVSVSPTSGMVIDYNGWLVIRGSGYSNDFNGYVYINGCNVAHAHGGSSNGAPDANTVMVLVSTGDVVTYSGYNSVSLWKVPFKGGNL